MDRVCTDSQGRVLLLNNTAFKLPSSVMEVNWNQLIQNGDFSNGTTYFSNNNQGTLSINGAGHLVHTAEQSSSIQTMYDFFSPHVLRNWIYGHRYYIGSKTVSSINNLFTLFFMCKNPYAAQSVYIQELTDNCRRSIFVYENSGTVDSSYISLYWEGNFVDGDTLEYFYLELIDLTQMFGAGNEPSTVEQFESWLQENGINPNTYIPYNAGTTRLMTRPSWLS